MSKNCPVCKKAIKDGKPPFSISRNLSEALKEFGFEEDKSGNGLSWDGVPERRWESQKGSKDTGEVIIKIYSDEKDYPFYMNVHFSGNYEGDGHYRHIWGQGGKAGVYKTKKEAEEEATRLVKEYRRVWEKKE